MSGPGRLRRRWRPAVPLVRLGVLILTGCGGEWASDLPAPDRRALEAWLFCDPCEGGERDSAGRVGSPAVEPLADLLRELPGSWRESLQASFGRAAARAQLAGGDSAGYATRHVGYATATLQSRAAMLLGDLAGSLQPPDNQTAIEALKDALRQGPARGYPAGVVRDVRASLLAVTTAPFDGMLRPAAAAFLDTIWVTQKDGRPWTGGESVVMHDAPFPQDVFVGFRGESLGFVAGAPVGRYAVLLTNLGFGPGADTQLATVRVTTFPAPPPSKMFDVRPSSLPLTFLRSLSSLTPPDTLHLFRFRPGATLTVTATAEWSGRSQINLSWDDCSTVAGFVRDSGVIAGYVVSDAGAALEGVSVEAVGAHALVQTGVDGQFRVPVPAGWTGSVRAERVGFEPATRPARESMGDIWIVLRVAGSPPATPLTRQLSQTRSPNSSRQTIPGGTCRLLGLLKGNAAEPHVIVRLRIVSP